MDTVAFSQLSDALLSLQQLKYDLELELWWIIS